MMSAVLLVISILFGLLGTILRKYFIEKNTHGVAGGFLFTAISSLIAGVVLVFWDGIDGVSLYTLILGAVFGIITSLQGVTNLLAIQAGPLSYTTVIISCSTVISALSGFFFFGENISWSHIVGIVLMLFSFFLATGRNKDEQKANWTWLIFCLITFFATGFIGIMQKIHQNSPYKDQLNLFLIVAFGVSAFFSFLLAAFLSRKQKSNDSIPNEIPSKQSDPKQKNKLHALILLIMVVCGICVAVNNKFNLYLSGVMDSAIFFPLVNGGGLILTTISAFVIFREKITKVQWCGLILGFLSVIFLCNPF